MHARIVPDHFLRALPRFSAYAANRAKRINCAIIELRLMNVSPGLSSCPSQ